MRYSVPAAEARFEQEIKKSRFIGVASRAASTDEVQRARRSLKSEFPDATHHCWAYVLGDPESSTQIRMDDDGEPAGTAGKPILSVLRHKAVGDILLVVVRYFGGTKLGAGGLVRAYSSTASGVMDALEIVTSTPDKDALLTLEYADESPARRLLEKLGVTVTSSTFTERVELTLRLPEDRWVELTTALRDLTSARAKLVAV